MKKAKTKMRSLICFFTVILICLIAIALLMLGNFRHKQAEKDVMLTLDAILNRTEAEEIYIYGLYNKSSSYNVFSENEAGAAISDRIQYRIDKVDLTAKNKNVHISISSPDVYKIVVEIVEENDSLNNTEDLLMSVLERLTTSYPTIENTVECSMQYKNGHWYIEPNEQLFNCLSGNLYSYYINLGKDAIENILGGNNNAE